MRQCNYNHISDALKLIHVCAVNRVVRKRPNIMLLITSAAIVAIISIICIFSVNYFVITVHMLCCCRNSIGSHKLIIIDIIIIIIISLITIMIIIIIIFVIIIIIIIVTIVTIIITIIIIIVVVGLFAHSLSYHGPPLFGMTESMVQVGFNERIGKWAPRTTVNIVLFSLYIPYFYHVYLSFVVEMRGTARNYCKQTYVGLDTYMLCLLALICPVSHVRTLSTRRIVSRIYTYL